jgi:hypothetical protein
VINYKRKRRWCIIKVIKKHLIIVFLTLASCGITVFFFRDILFSKSLIFPYSLNQFDIIALYPNIWYAIIYAFIVSNLITQFILLDVILFPILDKILQTRKNRLLEIELNKSGNLNIFLGEIVEDSKNKPNSKNESKQKVYLNERGLFQNILITGTIGSRKNKFGYVSNNKTAFKL